MTNSAAKSANSTPQQEVETTLSRGEFIRNLGMSSAALMAFYCMGTLSSCKGSSSDPAPVVITPPTTGGTSGLTGNSVTSGGAIDFTLDLTNSAYSTLKTVGSFVKVGDVFVFNAKGGVYGAVQRLCTHEGFDSLSYDSNADVINCSAHGSRFNTDGSVKTSPAVSALKKYTATLSGDKLQVKA